MKFLIFCTETRKFWKPDGCGYTSDVTMAGQYSLKRTREILIQANQEGRVNEMMVSVESIPKLQPKYLVRCLNDDKDAYLYYKKRGRGLTDEIDKAHRYSLRDARKALHDFSADEEAICIAEDLAIKQHEKGVAA